MTIEVPKSFKKPDFNWSGKEIKEEFSKWIGELCEEVSSLRRELQQTREEVAKLQKDKGSFSSLFQKPSGAVTNVERSEAKAQRANLITTFTDEVKEQARVGNNITIKGIQEATATDVEHMKKQDELEVKKILEAIGIQDVDVDGKTRRITKYDSTTKKRIQTDRVQVQLGSNMEQQNILEAAKRLKTIVGMKNVYINKELTQVENEREYQLRNERRKLMEKLKWKATDGRLFGIRKKRVFSWCIKFINGQRKVGEFWYNETETAKLKNGAKKMTASDEMEDSDLDEDQEEEN